MTPVPKPPRRGPKAKKRVRRQKKTSRAKLAIEADRLWSLVVRKRGACENARPECAGVLQAAHGFSRRYRGTRWLPINGFCLCQGCHVMFTHDPLRWEDYLQEAWGMSAFYELRDLAQRKADPDFPDIIAALEAELAR